jgi:SAM-dependent MidA family methyltransferase
VTNRIRKLPREVAEKIAISFYRTSNELGDKQQRRLQTTHQKARFIM